MSMSYELMMRKKEEIMYATIKGSLTENDGVFSGFSNSNYLSLQQPFKLNADTIAEFKVKINLTNNSILSGIIGTPNSYGMNFISANDSKLTLYLGNGSSWNILSAKKGTTLLQTDTDYYIRLLIDKGTITLLLSTDDITYTTEFTAVVTISEEYTYNLAYGRARGYEQYIRGSIDLNNSYIKLGATKYNLQAVVGYTVVGSPTITDGVVSGFSSANYLYLPSAPSWRNIDVLETFTTFTTSTMNTLQIVMGSRYSQATCCVEITSANKPLFRITYSDSGGTTKYKETTINYVLSANTKYKVKNYFNKQTLVIKSELYDENGIMLASESSSLASDYTFIANINDFWYGYNPQGGTFNGSIDLNNTYIKINNKLWFNGQQA